MDPVEVIDVSEYGVNEAAMRGEVGFGFVVGLGEKCCGGTKIVPAGGGTTVELEVV